MTRTIKKRWAKNFLICIFVFILLAFIRSYVNHPITGDEPHYILMTQSIVADQDFDLRNNYTNNDSSEYYPGLSPDRQISDSAEENWYSIHGYGLPTLIAPAFALAGVNGIILFLIFLATMVLYLSFVWAYKATKSTSAAMFASVALLVCYSFNGLAGYIYPDIPIILLSLTGLLIVNDEKNINKKFNQAILGVILGLLVLFHFKTLAFSIPLIGYLTLRSIKQNKIIPYTTYVVFGIILITFFTLTYQLYGSINPVDMYNNLSLSKASPFDITFGILFDSMRGLFINNPILLLVISGMIIWFKANKKSFTLAAIATLPTIVIYFSFGEWHGGDAPINRYAIDFLPILLPSIGFIYLETKKNWQKIILYGLLICTLLLSLDFISNRRDYVRYETRSPLFIQLSTITNIPFDNTLPTYTSTTKLMRGGSDKLILPFIILCGAMAYGIYLNKSRVVISEQTLE